ncbi:ribonuclease H-like domain-containing protein [Paraphoma chrysanthemicola]|uniref:ribonuclease H n=1 Tax=Paraphoma chrysanthemicola TaxID=798071 RepID=A0A8K0R2B5_9PLEO|nr:ribonuclease H-like domain-containing protein [Paraphoma chrysanthemicola]
MTRVTRSTAKEQWPAATIQSRRLKVGPSVSRVPEEVAAAREKLQQMEPWKQERGVHRRRLERLSIQILGPWPKYTGHIQIPDSITARMNDDQRLSDIAEYMKMVPTIVYWVDGSHSGSVGLYPGFMGAGVVWQDGAYQFAASYRLGRNVGCANDAELFAIAAALGLAKKNVEKAVAKGKDRHRYPQLVRIYSDSQSVLLDLPKTTPRILGPLLTQRTALEAIYDRTAWLTDHGVRVELIWVKGHSRSEGNKEADRLASQAIREQVRRLRESWCDEHDDTFEETKTEVDVPYHFKELGEDWVDEWLWRANGSGMRRRHALPKFDRQLPYEVDSDAEEDEDEDVFEQGEVVQEDHELGDDDYEIGENDHEVREEEHEIGEQNHDVEEEGHDVGTRKVDLGDQILEWVAVHLEEFDIELQLERQIQEDIAMREESRALFG